MKRAANRRVAWGAITVAAALCAGCSSTKGPGSPETASPSAAVRGYKVGNPYQIKGIWYYPKVDYDYSEMGVASWYGPGFHGKSTANGESYDMNELTAAHKTLPMPCVVRVTNLENGRSIKLRVNDRGPFVGDRIIDVSRRGAQLLGFYTAGTAQVKVDIVEDESRVLAGDYVPADRPADQAVAARAAEPEIGQVSAAVEQQAMATAVAADTPAAVYSAPQSAVSDSPVTSEPLPSYAPTPYADTTPSTNETMVPVGSAAVAYAPYADTPYTDAAYTGTAYAEPTPAYPRQMTAVVTPRAASHGQGPSGYYVQAGAFADAGRAHRVRQQLAAIGPAQVTPSRVNGRELLRVRLGPYNSDADVERALSRASQAGFPDARIVAD